MAAYEAGVNYYDTAYIYLGSETAIGKIFEKNGIRDKAYSCRVGISLAVESARSYLCILWHEFACFSRIYALYGATQGA